MKTLKNLVLVFALTIMTGTLFAQQGKGKGMKRNQQNYNAQVSSEQMVQKELNWMKTELSLDENTGLTVEGILNKYAKLKTEEMNKMRGTGNSDALRSKMAELDNQKKEEFKLILNNEQFEKYSTQLSQKPNRQNTNVNQKGKGKKKRS